MPNRPNETLLRPLWYISSHISCPHHNNSFFISLANSNACVATTTVMPQRFASSKRHIMSHAVSWSKFPVGSSAMSIDGLFTIALASATLKHSPPQTTLFRISIRFFYSYLPVLMLLVHLLLFFLSVSLIPMQKQHFHIPSFLGSSCVCCQTIPILLLK